MNKNDQELHDNNTSQDGNCTNCSSPNVESFGRNQIRCRDCDFVCSVYEHAKSDGTKSVDITNVISPYILASDWCTVIDVYDTFFSEQEKKLFDSFESTIFVKFSFPQYGTMYNFKKVEFPGKLIFCFPDGNGNLYSHLEKRCVILYGSKHQGMYQEAIRNNWLAITVLQLDEKFKKHKFKALSKLHKIFSKMDKNHG